MNLKNKFLYWLSSKLFRYLPVYPPIPGAERFYLNHSNVDLVVLRSRGVFNDEFKSEIKQNEEYIKQRLVEQLIVEIRKNCKFEIVKVDTRYSEVTCEVLIGKRREGESKCPQQSHT